MENEQGERQPETAEAQVYPSSGTRQEVTDNTDEGRNQVKRVQDHRSQQSNGHYMDKVNHGRLHSSGDRYPVPGDNRRQQSSGDRDRVPGNNRQFEQEKQVPAPDYPTEDTATEAKTDARLTGGATENVDIVEFEKLKKENKKLSEERDAQREEINRLKTNLKQKEIHHGDSKIDPISQAPDVKNMTIDKEKQSTGMEIRGGGLYEGMLGENSNVNRKDNQKMGKVSSNQLDSDVVEYQHKIHKLTVDLEKADSLARDKKRELQELEAKLHNESQSKSTLKSQMKKLEFEKNEALTRYYSL
jgi:hypothetical protein